MQANARIAGVRIPHPKIEELALQAQGVGIFAQRAKFSRITTLDTAHAVRFS